MSGASPARGRADQSLLGPTAYGIAVLAMNVAFIVAGLAALYLLFAALVGAPHFGELTKAADKARVLGNIAIAAKALRFGLGAGSIAAGVVFLTEETIGLVMLAAAALIGFGIPYAYTFFGGDPKGNLAAGRSLGAFPAAVLVPFGVAGLLIARDIVVRLATAIRGKPEKKEDLTYGGAAEKEQKPVRLSLFAKCWEGPFCREFVRTQCPIYLKREACWRVKRGCYCEEDIVTAAATRVSGVTLDMAPDRRYNFANPGGGGAATAPKRIELTMSQKKQRCRNCVIYNEHQREKYKILMPVVLIGGAVLCFFLLGSMRHYLGTGLAGIEGLMSRLSFLPGEKTPKMGKPSETTEWVFIGAFSVMFISKLLQGLEWACFKAKI